MNNKIKLAIMNTLFYTCFIFFSVNYKYILGFIFGHIIQLLYVLYPLLGAVFGVFLFITTKTARDEKTKKDCGFNTIINVFFPVIFSLLQFPYLSSSTLNLWSDPAYPAYLLLAGTVIGVQIINFITCKPKEDTGI